MGDEQSNKRPAIVYCTGKTMEEQLAALGDDKTILVLSVSREEIEAGLTGNLVDRLMTLSDSPEHTRRFANATVFSVDGYNNDPRELYEIDDVVAFIRKVDEIWPYWFHFLEKDRESMGIVLMLLIGARTIRGPGGQLGALFERDRIQPVMARQFGGMNQLYEMHGVSAEDNAVMTAQIDTCLDRIIQQER